MTKAKFKIGDIVQMKDEFRFNPCYKVVSIGKVQAIHIYRGESYTHKPGKKPTSLKGRIIYTISGFSVMPEEGDLQPYKEGG